MHNHNAKCNELQFKRFLVNFEQHESESHLANNADNVIVKNLQEKFVISEEWFSNQDGLLTDCFVGTTCEKDTVVTMNKHQDIIPN